MKRYLHSICYYVLGQKVDISRPEGRLAMQRIIYLLQEIGICIGDYAFYWCNCGPYSPLLREDMHTLSKDCVSVDYTDDTREILDILKDMVHQETAYNMDDWLDCLASLYYLWKNVMPMDADDADIISELEFRKPYLSNRTENEKALITLRTCYTL